VDELPAHGDPADSTRAKRAEPAAAAGDARGIRQPEPTAAARLERSLRGRGTLSHRPPQAPWAGPYSPTPGQCEAQEPAKRERRS